MIANGYATDKTADRTFVKEVSSSEKFIGEITRLKIRWAVKGPCRFESGHRQFRGASVAGKCENFRFA